MEFIWVGVGVCAWLFSILLLGLICGMTDEKPRALLTRRPNVRLVRHEEEVA